ncbi:MAG TPA: helix-turn-helix transcriptional regulator [Caulobacteraceae bacterium]|nr:helix-turn-helix transcriptional regulator [Caulobacteraceae bacterium]
MGWPGWRTPPAPSGDGSCPALVHICLEHGISDSSPNRRESGPSGSRRGLDPLDAQIGERLRRRRLALRLSARVVGQAVGVSQQQIHRYETGADRIAVSTFLRICSALELSVAAACDGLEAPMLARRESEPVVGTAERLLADFDAIREPAIRARLCSLIAAIAQHQPAD